jgi:predicted lipoprotein with Yx(FWY)xxD motif
MLNRAIAAAAAATALLGGLAGCNTNPWAKPQPTPVAIVDFPAYPMNGALATPTGVTLYSFDKDALGAGTSACNGPCATLWPALPAPAGAVPKGNFTIVKREDGSQQWAYRGWPLYTYAKDARPGDRSGDNFNNAWHLVKP